MDAVEIERDSERERHAHTHTHNLNESRFEGSWVGQLQVALAELDNLLDGAGRLAGWCGLRQVPAEADYQQVL